MSDPSEPVSPSAPSTEAQGVPMGAGRRRAALGFIFVTALLDILAIGIVIPVLPQLVKGFTHGDIAKAAGYVGVFGAVWALMQFIASPIQGALSDHFGRRPVLLASVFGLGCDYVLMALAPNVGWLFVGRLISGITAASFSTANAYVADITPPEKRAQSFGLMGSAFGIGFIVGPAVGGVLGQIGPRLPFWFAAGLCFLNFAYGLFILPESLPKSRRAPFKFANASPLGSLRLLVSQRELTLLGCVLFCYFLAFQVLPSTSVLYTTYRYGWGPSLMGLALGGMGLANIVVQLLLVKPVVRRVQERGALMIGLGFAAAGVAIYGLAPSGLIYWAGLPVYAIVGLVQPGAQGMMTRRIGPREQGRLQGANASIMAMTGLIGPLLFTQVFAHAIAGPRALAHPGVAFYLASILLVCGLLVSLTIPRHAASETAAAAAGT